MERILDLLIETALHGLVAALVVELLIRRLPVLALPPRAALRWFALTLPLVSVPVLAAIPARNAPAFPDVALFWSARWADLFAGPWSLRITTFAVFAAVGLALLIRDAVRDAAHSLRERHLLPHHTGPEDHALDEARLVLDQLSRAQGWPTPTLVRSADRAPILLTRGLLRPHIVISAAVVERLRPEGLRAALAHELSHVRHHDVRRGVLLAVLRALQWFNPVSQVLARRVTQETEWRADEDAVAWAGSGPALARALLESVRGRHGDFLGAFGHARIAALELRCRRVLGRRLDPPGLSTAEFLAVAAAVCLLVVFVR